MKTAGVLLTLAVGLLVAAGLATLSSLSVYDRIGTGSFNRQWTWILIGLAPALVLAAVDYRRLRMAGWALFGLVLVLLVLARIPGIGRVRNGAWRWIDIGPFDLQPSELGKLALILVLAAYVDRFQRVMGTLRHGLLVPALLVGPLLALVLFGKDYGTTALLGAVAGTMLLVGGTRLRHLALPAVAGVLALAAAVVADPLRSRRIEAWLHPEQHSKGVAHQAIQSVIALGSGGPFGRGLGEGVHKRGFVPEQHTDFIFSAIGEEAGLVGTLAVILAYLLILGAGIGIACRARETFGMLVAFGASFTIALQAFINIGVVTAVLPNKGIALPFVSYGGSSMVSMLALVGLLFSVARHAVPVRDEELPAEDRDTAANPFARP
ncbi:MAG: FtsW/RodA/SpoVE family cell cycle protein [Limisphaerales bacterium]